MMNQTKTSPQADKLDQIFKLQGELDAEICRRWNMENISVEEWVQKEALAIMAELGELIAEVNYKWWKQPKPIDWKAVTEETIDVFHFVISLCLKLGITADDLHKAYEAKNLVNWKRQEIDEEHQNGG